MARLLARANRSSFERCVIQTFLSTIDAEYSSQDAYPELGKWVFNPDYTIF
jgi:hypothetical protein